MSFIVLHKKRTDDLFDGNQPVIVNVNAIQKVEKKSCSQKAIVMLSGGDYIYTEDKFTDVLSLLGIRLSEQDRMISRYSEDE